MSSSSGSRVSSSSMSSFCGKTGGDDAGAVRISADVRFYYREACLRLEGGAAEEEGRLSSSASLPLFRPPGVWRPRLAADMLGRSGELAERQSLIGAAEFPSIPH